MNRHDADEYCRHKAAPPGSNCYYSMLYYPEQLRLELCALHALGVELEEVITECSDPGVMRMKLAWWQEEIARLYQHAARHPVSQALEHVIARHGIPEHQLLHLVSKYEHLGAAPVLHPWPEFLPLLANGPGRLWSLAADLCGNNEPDTIALAVDMGSLISGFQLLQQPPPSGIDFSTQINHQECDHRIKCIQEKLEYNCSIFPQGDRARQLHILIMSHIISRTCQEILRRNRKEGRRLALTPLRKLWIAWRLQRLYRGR